MLLEQIIANNPSLQPYEYDNTEIAEDRHRLVLHLAAGREQQKKGAPTAKDMCMSWAAAA